MTSTPPRPGPKPGFFSLGTWLFLRTLAVVHLIAFASYWVQIPGLLGPHGLLPAGRLFEAARSQLGAAAYARLPSLCWFFGTGWFLHALCAAGVGLSLMLFAGFAPALCAALLWACYLSLVCAGQVFYNFQWDVLLLEATLLAVFVAPWTLRRAWQPVEPPRLARWLIWWLLFRLMLMSGVVKLTSGDDSWWRLTALTVHYETQPLPTPLAWYAAHLPLWFQKFSCAVMFAIELGAPFALFAPRRIRHPAVLSMIGFQVLIALTGNYTFFNLLTIAICLPCLDDAFLSKVFSRRVFSRIESGEVPGGRPREAPKANERRPEGTSPDSIRENIRRRFLRAFATFAIFATVVGAAAEFVPGVAFAPAVGKFLGALSPFRSFNNYGLFRVMTPTRPELIFEGSNDGIDWRPYELPYKPGDLARRPPIVAPYQPRLDWQLWFAALERPQQNPWVFVLCEQLLRGNPEVLSLFSRNPFPGHPPRLIRVTRYEYHFTTAAERAASGRWWRRYIQDFYVQPSSLP